MDECYACQSKGNGSCYADTSMHSGLNGPYATGQGDLETSSAITRYEMEHGRDQDSTQVSIGYTDSERAKQSDNSLYSTPSPTEAPSDMQYGVHPQDLQKENKDAQTLLNPDSISILFDKKEKNTASASFEEQYQLANLQANQLPPEALKAKATADQASQPYPPKENKKPAKEKDLADMLLENKSISTAIIS